MNREVKYGNMSVLDLGNLLVDLEVDLLSRGCRPSDCVVVFGDSDNEKIYSRVDFILGQRENTKDYELHILLSNK